MKNISIIFVTLIIILGCCHAQGRQYRATDEKSMRIVPLRVDDDRNYKPFLKFRRAEPDDIIGNWEFIDTQHTTIEFKSDSLNQTFYFYDGVSECGSGGKWSGSFYDDILIVTLTHFDIDVTEKLAVQVINRKTLALGTVVNGKFDYRYRIKK